MDWKKETTLGDIAALTPWAPIEIKRGSEILIKSTAAQLLREGRLPNFLSVDQVEFAFSKGKARAEVLAPAYLKAVAALDDVIMIPMYDLSRLPIGHPCPTTRA